MATASALISANTVVPKPCSRAVRCGTRVTPLPVLETEADPAPGDVGLLEADVHPRARGECCALAPTADRQPVEDDGALAVLRVHDHGREDLPLAAAQHPGLDGVDSGPLHFAGPPVGGRHEGRQLGQRRAQFGRRLGTGAQREADLGAEAVDQPPQRGGDVGVRGAATPLCIGCSGGAPSNGV